MMPWSADSLMIRASAGYGKTEKLCLRLLAMMLNDPEMIGKVVALTFTRSAAAEIYDRLLALICKALTEENGVGQLRGRIADSVSKDAAAATTEERLRELLRRLVDAMGELNISTIDSFFYRLVCAYAIELGLPGRAELVSEGDKTTADALLREALHAEDGGGRDFLEACRESHHGEEKKSFFSSCVELLTAIGKYEDLHAGDFWGGPFAEAELASQAELEAAFDRCERNDWGNKTRRYRENLSGVFLECARAHTPDYHFGSTALEILRAFFRVLDRFPEEQPDGFKQRGWNYAPVAADIVLLVGNAAKVLRAQCARRTHGLGQLLEVYRAIYDREMLRKGRINFSDLPRLLGAGAWNVKTSEALYAAVAEIQYRVNSRFNHFLIDEFQDTSRLQWNALEPCVGDNGDGDHSLFIVGDVKQAIYGWREGDSKLMGEIAAAETLIPEGHVDDLPCSYRYGQKICDRLNYLFGAENLSRFTLLPEKTKKRWKDVFRTHAPSEKTPEDPGKKVPVPGEFAVYALAPTGNRDFAKRAAALIRKWLADHDFFAGGHPYSVGVLVRNNKDGIALRDALVELDREHADLFVWESDEKIASDPLVAALIAFAVAVQFPGETLAAETVRMHPLLRELVSDRAKWLDILGEAGVSGLLQAVLKNLYARAASRNGGERIAPPADANLDTLLAVAREFDAVTGDCDMRRFRDRALLAKKPAAPAEGKLRILTVHHSKGLTFNVVFYPMFDNTQHGNWRNPDLKGAVSNGKWLLYSPREEGMLVTDVADALKQRHEDLCFEELCSLYVALTRADRGTYVLLPPRSKEKLQCFHPDWHADCTERQLFADSDDVESYYLSDMVFESFFSFDARFAVDRKLPVDHTEMPIHKEGEPEKYPENDVAFILSGAGSFDPPAGKVAKRAGALRIDWSRAAETAPRPRRITPSHLAEGGDAKRLYFTLPDPDKGAELGTRLHELFAKIDRWSDFTLPADTAAVLRRHYEACAGNPEVKKLFDEDCEVWKERLFDVILPDGDGGRAMVTGCFDRVHIRRNAAREVAGACIIDFKSNDTTEKELPDLCEHYRRQLEIYRAALAKLLGIMPEVIECKLLFTKLGVLEKI